MNVRSFFLLSLVALLAAGPALGLTRDDIVRNAMPYQDLRWSSKNSLNKCQATTWIRTPHPANKTITGMAYCWGGNDTPANFTKAIAGSGLPGNACTIKQGNNLNHRPNTFGTDCSGFWARLVGITRKINTTEVRSLTVPVRGDRSGLRTADILVKAGDHVSIYLGGSPTSAPVIVESSGYDWRVIQRTARWSEFNGYEARRYAQLQDAGIAKFERFTAPSTIRKAATLNVQVTLRETDGNNITYDAVTVAVLNNATGAVVFDLPHQYNVLFGGDKQRTFSFSAKANLVPGTYRLVARGRVGTRWSDFVPYSSTPNSVRLTVTQ